MKDLLGAVLSRLLLVALRLVAAVVLFAGAARGDDTVKVFDGQGFRQVPFDEYLDSLVGPRVTLPPVVDEPVSACGPAVQLERVPQRVLFPRLRARFGR